MAKRFTDTLKWTNNKWFFSLSKESKLFWIYLLDSCDSVGVWEENIELSNRIIGYEYSLDTLLKDFSKQIFLFKDNRKWWIKDFCDFQYGELREDSISKPIQSYISLLKKHGLFKEYLKGMQSLKEKEKEEDEEMEEEINIPFIKFWDLYDKKIGDKDKIKKKWDKLKNQDRIDIIEYIPKYKKSQPDKKFRKNPETFLNNKSWHDEIIEPESAFKKSKLYKPDSSQFPID